MPYTKTAAVRQARRTLAEEVQARSAKRPLEQRVRVAGKKELAKFIKRLGQEKVDTILDLSMRVAQLQLGSSTW